MPARPWTPGDPDGASIGDRDRHPVRRSEQRSTTPATETSPAGSRASSGPYRDARDRRRVPVVERVHGSAQDARWVARSASGDVRVRLAEVGRTHGRDVGERHAATPTAGRAVASMWDPLGGLPSLGSAALSPAVSPGRAHQAQGKGIRYPLPRVARASVRLGAPAPGHPSCAPRAGDKPGDKRRKTRLDAEKLRCTSLGRSRRRRAHRVRLASA